MVARWVVPKAEQMAGQKAAEKVGKWAAWRAAQTVDLTVPLRVARKAD